MLQHFLRSAFLVSTLFFLVNLPFVVSDSSVNGAALAQGPPPKPDQSGEAPTSDAGVDSSEQSYVDGQNTAGTVRVNNLANLEALLNIIANGMEIMGIASVGSFFAGAIIAFIKKRPFMGAALLFLCPVSITVGLATPGVINWLVASARDAGMVDSMGLMVIPVVLVLGVGILAVGFFPAMLAFRMRHQHKWAIFACTFVSWLVPFGWPALLFWALWDKPDQAGKSTAS